MEYDQWTVPRLRDILKERGVRGYLRQRKAWLIAILRATDPQPPSTWELMRRRPLHPMRPPSPPPAQKPGGPPKLKKIKWLEKKKRNLESQI